MVLKKVGLSLATTASVLSLGSCGFAEEISVKPLTLDQALEMVSGPKPEPEPEPEPEVETEPRWVGDNFNENETKALEFFQEYGITDRMALSVLLGNIKQESNFHPNICEGGARINYPSCHRGGYGLIQWTTSFRYWGLGNHAKVIKGNPSEINTQLSYLVTEREWKEALWRFNTPNESLKFYMKGAYRWLGWGIYGNRGYYAQQYYKRLSLS